MPTISTKEAVARAKQQLLELYEDDPPRELALEEIELVSLDDARQAWAVTLGFARTRNVTVTNPTGVSMSALLGTNTPTEVEHRVYKTLLLDANTGDFVKMDMHAAP
jgi:hypothetical protein